MQLTKHFTLAELTKSGTAMRLGIDNTPDKVVIENLKRLAVNILEPVRAHFGTPFSPSSTYRSSELNKAVGGAATSQHMAGNATDFEVPGIPNFELASYIRDTLFFDQLILEFPSATNPRAGWVHCSFVPVELLRHEALTAVKRDGRTQYLKGLLKE